jgi:hypothetical protein
MLFFATPVSAERRVGKSLRDQSTSYDRVAFGEGRDYTNTVIGTIRLHRGDILAIFIGSQTGS